MLAVAALFATGVHFVILHGPDGQQYIVNPQQITSMREPSPTDLRHFSRGTHCVIVTTSGKFIAVMETCNEVRDRIDKLQ